MKLSEEFYFKTNKEFNDYIKSCGVTNLLRLYRYTQSVMKEGDFLQRAGAMMDALEIYPYLIEYGYSRKELI